METNVITTVFNAQEALPINDEARITKAQVLFLYAAANAAADRPSIIRVDEGPLPFTDVAEAAPRYGEIRQWLGTFLDNNLVFRAVIPISDGTTVVSEIKRLSHECTDAGLMEFCPDDDTLYFTALGTKAIENTARCWTRSGALSSVRYWRSSTNVTATAASVWRKLLNTSPLPIRANSTVSSCW